MFPSSRFNTPNSAPQSRVAFASVVSNTGSSSPGELEITSSTSDVAFCCSSDSDSSRVRACTSSKSRTFSIAITAWSAKVVTSSISLSVNGATIDRVSAITPIGAPSRSSGTPSIVRKPPIFWDSIHVYSGSARQSGKCTVRAVSAVRPTSVLRAGEIG